MEKHRCRRDDEYRREGEERLRDAGGCELRGEQRRADTDERAEDGGGEHAPHRLTVADGVTELLQAVFVEDRQSQEETDEPDVCADGGGGKRHADAGGKL